MNRPTTLTTAPWSRVSVRLLGQAPRSGVKDLGVTQRGSFGRWRPTGKIPGGARGLGAAGVRRARFTCRNQRLTRLTGSQRPM